MRICLVSRCRSAAGHAAALAGAGHDLTLVSQVGGPAAAPGVRVVALEAFGERTGDYEADVDAIVFAVMREHSAKPFDVVHGYRAYPTGWAAMIAAKRLGLPCAVSVADDDGWDGSCCEMHRIAIETVIDRAGALVRQDGVDWTIYERLRGTRQQAFDAYLPIVPCWRRAVAAE